MIVVGYMIADSNLKYLWYINWLLSLLVVAEIFMNWELVELSGLWPLNLARAFRLPSLWQRKTNRLCRPPSILVLSLYNLFICICNWSDHISVWVKITLPLPFVWCVHVIQIQNQIWRNWTLMEIVCGGYFDLKRSNSNWVITWKEFDGNLIFP